MIQSHCSRSDAFAIVDVENTPLWICLSNPALNTWRVTYLIEWVKYRRTIRRILHFLPPLRWSLPRPHRYPRWDKNARLSLSCEIDSSINSRTDGLISITPVWCSCITILDHMFIRKINSSHLNHMRFVISLLHRWALSWRINECSLWPSKITLWRSNVIHQAP